MVMFIGCFAGDWFSVILHHCLQYYCKAIFKSYHEPNTYHANNLKNKAP
jgi:hypothetical protein